MLDKFEVVLPHSDERAHRRHPGFHTFYMNQIDMGLKFPIPKFISSLCQHIKISPSQLAPNSYSFLLAPAILLRYHNIPLIPYVLMQLVHIKRQGPGKFYLSHKGDHTFIKGNPSSHKGWMSRFFYVKRAGNKRNPWRKGVELVRDLGTAVFCLSHVIIHIRAHDSPGLTFALFLPLADERMGKAAMLKAWDEVEEGSSMAATPLKKAAKKRKASTPAEKESRRHKKKGASSLGSRSAPTTETCQEPTPPVQTIEERPDPTPVVNIPEAFSLKMGPTKEAGPGRVPPLDFFEDSLVVSASGAVATRFLCHIAPDRDIGRLSGASISSNLASALDWKGEVIKRLTRAQRETNDLRRHFDDMTEHCTQLEMRLAEVEAPRADDERAAEARRADLETRGLRLEAERAALMAEKRAMVKEKESLEAKKATMRSKLDETKARAEEEAGRLRSEAIHASDLGKEEFLKSSEFDTLCAKKVVSYFKVGFEGCVAQFRANDYSEEEHPAPFLDVKKALMDIPDEDEEEADEEEEEEDDADATPPPPPSNSPKP
ncbi:hypothetical protein F511_21156 [Dorcoceras hygrometricum]|uniref:Uncharacterized protein n=1 Tax=Dorcoceras hygrometricum TaxID=472368 RepID=A0A2Z7CGU5_9LAMI|nr:hypothetical protein F511_21156 [Dorcoceras hygrometricum]